MIKVFKFGLVPKTKIKEIEDIFQVSNSYYNSLVEIYRHRENLEFLTKITGLDSLIDQESVAYDAVVKAQNKKSQARIDSRSKIDDLEIVKTDVASRKGCS